MRFLLPLILALAATPLAAQTPDHPAAFSRLLECRQLTDGAQRLACFDAATAALDEAAQRREVVVMDQEQVRQTRRGLFGLTLPSINLFGGSSDEQDGVSEIEDTVRAVASNPYGRWILTLENGQRWAQTDTRRLPIEPRVGNPIRIRRAAMGSYLANVNNQVAMRMERLR